MKSMAWYPEDPLGRHILLDEMIPDSFRHKDGPVLGRKAFWINESFEVGAQCNMTHWSIDMALSDPATQSSAAGLLVFRSQETEVSQVG